VGTPRHSRTGDPVLTHDAGGLEQQVDGVAGEQGHRRQEEAAGGQRCHQQVTAPGSDTAMGQTLCSPHPDPPTRAPRARGAHRKRMMPVLAMA